MVLPFVIFLFACLAQPGDNAELKKIYDADQQDREGPTTGMDWRKIGPRDAARRKRVRELIDGGRLQTGKDYERAALVFQHGDTADEILLAHVLAVTALGKGNLESRWLAAATLDRFLQRLGQPQIFGSQVTARTEGGRQTWTMEPYNRELIDPKLREANCIPDLEDQAEALKTVSRSGALPAPKRPPCAEAPKP